MAAYETSLGGDYLPLSLTLVATAIDIFSTYLCTELCDHFDIRQASGHQTTDIRNSKRSYDQTSNQIHCCDALHNITHKLVY